MQAEHSARIRIACRGPDEAARIGASLAPDDDGHLSVGVEGDTLVLEASSGKPMGLLRTLDETLAAIGAAQKADRLGARG